MKDNKNYNTSELIILANKLLDDLNSLLNKIDDDLLALREFKEAA